MKRYFAHSKPQLNSGVSPEDEWEPLFTPLGQNADECSMLTCEHCKTFKPDHGHLNKVAYWSAGFAEDMFARDLHSAESVRAWGSLVGLWHDLGKYSDAFQDYIRQPGSGSHEGEIKGRVDHATAGAQHAHKTIENYGYLFSYLIAGHHAGLADGIAAASEASLESRLKKDIPAYQGNAPESLLNFSSELNERILCTGGKHEGLNLSFFMRMLFSTLVDADFLATESFMSPEKKTARTKCLPPMLKLEKSLKMYIIALQNKAARSPVNQIREQIYNKCLQAAPEQPGFFSLTVPTGGGKTLSSLAFALAHARKHNLRRVIYVIPYTSIIEQNAKVFREALAQFGPEVVLEHHSNFGADEDKQSTWSRLAAENWDARIIVTTNVQFFESLHANRPSRCRKLHNIARSVVILDEAQNLPVGYLDPCLRTLEQLVKSYGTSVVLCTATQPAIESNAEFSIGIEQPKEIIPDPGKFYRALRRVKCENLRTRLNNVTLAAKLAEHRQVLCIVNTRRHAREVFDLLPDDDHRYHLSTLMCPEHRKSRLAEIKNALEAGKPVRLIATQLIEAGVDIDFPVVYRAMAGLDSIAQAAGRCDREGTLTQRQGSPGGQMIIFTPDESAPPGIIRNSAETAGEVLSQTVGDPLGLDRIEEYFRLYYWKNGSHTDNKDILGCWPSKITREEDFLRFKFRTCAQNFHLIDDDHSLPVLVPYEGAPRLAKELENAHDPQKLRTIARKLQRYTVNIPEWQHRQLRDAGVLYSLHDERFFVLACTSHYSPEYGLHTKEDVILALRDSIW